MSDEHHHSSTHGEPSIDKSKIRKIIWIVFGFILIVSLYFAARINNTSAEENNSFEGKTHTSTSSKIITVSDFKEDTFISITEEIQLNHDERRIPVTVFNTDTMYVDGEKIAPGQPWPNGFKQLRKLKPYNGGSTLFINF